LSNLNKKELQKLAAAFARELSELTGESTSRLFEWGSQHDLQSVFLGSRQTFYNHLEMRGWTRSSAETMTQDCHLGSHPFTCRLRLRVVSLVTQFARDVKEGKKRQLIILFGYEVCSQLIHFRVYRGPADECDDVISVREKLRVETVSEFVKECGRMIGLPLQRVIFTQDLIKLPAATANEVAYLSLKLGEMKLRKEDEEPADNEVLCDFTGALNQFLTLDGEHPFITWCQSTDATALTDQLTEMVKLHNKTNALPRLATGQNVFEALLKKSDAANKEKYGPTDWEVPLPSFLKRMSKNDYVLQSLSLHEVRYHNRLFQNFNSSPGDCPFREESKEPDKGAATPATPKARLQKPRKKRRQSATTATTATTCEDVACSEDPKD
jgi:hypothetical protein